MYGSPAARVLKAHMLPSSQLQELGASSDDACSAGFHFQGPSRPIVGWFKIC